MRSRSRALLLSAALHIASVMIAAWYVRAHRRDDSDRAPIDLALLWAQRGAPSTSTPVEIVERPTPVEARPSSAHPSASIAAHVVIPSPHDATSTNGNVEPLPDPNAQNGLPPASPFMTWAPGQEPHHPASTGSGDFLATVDRDAERAAAGGALGSGAVGNGGLVDAPGGRAQAIDASQGFVRRMLDDASPTQIPGSADYYRHVSVAASRAWHPMPVPEPSLLQGVIGTFFAPTSVAMNATERSLGPLATGRAGAAAAEVDAAHPNSPMLQPTNTMAARAAATAQTTRVEVEVDQDASGRIVAMRVTRRSGVAGYDRAALDAIRAAIAQQDPRTMPGGWRSRWEFSVTMSRDPILSALPGLPGQMPNIGIAAEASFDEVTGETELHLPGMLHRRRLVRLISSHVIEQPARATR